jgi:hypothetical protein
MKLGGIYRWAMGKDRDLIIYSGDNQPGKSCGAIIQDGRWVGLNFASPVGSRQLFL